MERTMTVEERIRRAEEIYAKRRKGEVKTIATVNVNREKKDIRLLKKMIIQLLICVTIYFVIYIIQQNKYVFSEDFINKTKEIISYDMDFGKIYNNISNSLNGLIKKEENVEETNTENQNGIGGAEENVTQEVEESAEQQEEISQTDQDVINVKNTTTFIKPIEGVISSKYGIRETATGTVPKNHTGTDIASTTGVKIKSATDGEVVLSSEEGDYGKHLKIQIGEVSIIYAHCNALYVKQGDIVKQGQEIAEVGSTGNSTGPHLHFEIRYQERTVDPQLILEL